MKELDINQISEILPHKYPFLLIDKVIDIEPGKKVVAIKNVTSTEDFFKGHFPGKPIMPGALIVEAMAQASIIIYYSQYKDDLKDIPQYYLGSVKARFKQAVHPGQQLKIEAQAVKVLPTGAFINAKTFCEGKEVAEAELIFAVKQR